MQCSHSLKRWFVSAKGRRARRACQRGIGLSVGRVQLLLAAKAQILPNVPGEPVFDFGMSRHGLFLAGPRIDVDVVTGPRADKHTAVAH